MFDKVGKDEAIGLLAVVGAVYVAIEALHLGNKVTKRIFKRKEAKASS